MFLLQNLQMTEPSDLLFLAATRKSPANSGAVHYFLMAESAQNM
jgi:hypothetical protein